MKWIVFSLLIIFSLPSLAQKKKEKPNWLRQAAPEPETWFTFCGKKNGKRVKVIELEKAEGVKLSEKLFDGMDILGMDVVIKVKGAGEEKFSSPNTKISSELKLRMLTLAKGDKLFFYVKTRNRSTQVVNVVAKHTFYVAG